MRPSERGIWPSFSWINVYRTLRVRMDGTRSVPDTDMINWHPTDRHVRNFALVSVVTLPLATALWTRGSLPAMNYATLIGGGLGIIGAFWPRALRPLVVAVNVLTAPLALIAHDLVLSLAFFCVVVPVGLLFRLFGRDPLQLKNDRRAATYWQAKKPARDVRSYFRRW